MTKRLPTFAIALFTAAALPACRSAYYGTMEAFGVHKRDILVDRVKDGREAQAEAKEEIVSALDAFREIANFDGGDLEKLYGRLKSKYDSSADAVSDVKGRIRSIEQVSKDLFREWASEIDGMQNAELARKSEELLRETKQRCADLVGAMKAAESKMEPVLVAFKDHVTFLKHNLNARAVASLQDQLVAIETDVARLVSDMERSIAEADAFIASMEQSGS